MNEMRDLPQMRKNVARDRDHIVLVILSVVAGYFNMEISVNLRVVFAEDHG